MKWNRRKQRLEGGNLGYLLFRSFQGSSRAFLIYPVNRKMQDHDNVARGTGITTG